MFYVKILLEYGKKRNFFAKIKRILKQENSNHIILFEVYPEGTQPEGFSFLNVGTRFFYFVHTVVVLCTYG
jgi:hypothetical protein